MIKHVVMFKLKDTAVGSTKIENAVKIKELLDQLPDKISQIVEFEVGIDVVRAERSWDLVLISAFNSMAELDEYRIHPEHLKALEFIAPRREIVSAVDYDY